MDEGHTDATETTQKWRPQNQSGLTKDKWIQLATRQISGTLPDTCHKMSATVQNKFQVSYVYVNKCQVTYT